MLTRNQLLHVAIAILLLTLLLPGCRQKESSPRSSASRRASSSDQSSAMLQSVATALASLPDRSILTLKPPVIVLDASKSADHQDVMAKLTRSTPTGPPRYDRLEVTSRNSQFRRVARPGDSVKFYGVVSSELSEEFGNTAKRLSQNQIEELSKLPKEAREKVVEAMIQEMMLQDDFVTTRAIELTVAQVIDANTLLIEPVDPIDLANVSTEMPVRMEILRYDDAHFRELRVALTRYADQGIPRLGWEPSPDRESLRHIVERLNRWLRQKSARVDWHVPKLLETLPGDLRDAEDLQLFISDEALDRNAFSLPTDKLRALQSMAYEGRLLQEATWARDIGNWLTEDEPHTLPRIEKMFDWTLGSLQLDDASDAIPSQRPWQSLVAGHATAEGRAWVFAQLCRQQNVPVVVFHLASPSDAKRTTLWCGALVGDRLYLFDPAMGLPLTDGEGKTLSLAQVLKNPQLLRRFDLPDEPYLVDASSLESLTAQVVAGPFSLTRRAALLEERFTSDAALRLRVDADSITSQLGRHSSVAQVQLWDYPYRVLLSQIHQRRGRRTRAAIEFEPFVYRPRLWKARLLHFRGRQETVTDASRDNVTTPIDDHRDAGRLYFSDKVRPTTKVIDRQPSPDTRRAWTKAKENATYWLGRLCYDRGEPETAIAPWFEMSAKIDGWKRGTRYNHARALEALGKTAEAADLLQADDSPQRRGSQLRAKWLEKPLKESPSRTPAP